MHIPTFKQCWAIFKYLPGKQMQLRYIGIGEPISDQKLKYIVAVRDIEILFPCSAIFFYENPKVQEIAKK